MNWCWIARFGDTANTLLRAPMGGISLNGTKSIGGDRSLFEHVESRLHFAFGVLVATSGGHINALQVEFAGLLE